MRYHEFQIEKIKQRKIENEIIWAFCVCCFLLVLVPTIDHICALRSQHHRGCLALCLSVQLYARTVVHCGCFCFQPNTQLSQKRMQSIHKSIMPQQNTYLALIYRATTTTTTSTTVCTDDTQCYSMHYILKPHTILST